MLQQQLAKHQRDCTYTHTIVCVCVYVYVHVYSLHSHWGNYMMVRVPVKHANGVIIWLPSPIEAIL